MSMSSDFKKRVSIGLCAIIFLFFLWGIYVPHSLSPKPTAVYTLQKGLGYKDIAKDLKKQGIIRSYGFFNIYVLISFNYRRLQAGNYALSPSMSVSDIVKK